MKKNYLRFLLGILILSLSVQQTMTQEETQIGSTLYDLQTLRAMQNRIFRFNDGSIGAVWNMDNFFPVPNNLGIGYNYFDGYNWGAGSNFPITSGWAINPSYTDYGENGELCVSQGQNGLYICTREIKGQGPWQEFNLAGNLLKHPVIVTAGASNDIFHLLYLESDPDFIPTEPQPVRGEIWYTSSQDNGQTWNSIPMPGLGPDFYLGFTMAAYCWAEPRGNVACNGCWRLFNGSHFDEIK